MKKLLIILLVFSFNFLHAGEYGDAFLELGVGGRNMAMGNSISALDTNNTCFYANCAGLASIRSLNLDLMYTSHFGLAYYNHLGLAFPLTKTISGAINWLRFGVNNIYFRPDYFITSDYSPEERRQKILINQGKGFGSFSDTEDGFYFSLAKMNKIQVYLGWLYENLELEIPVGVSVKVLHKQLNNNIAWGIGTDVSTRCRFHLGTLMGIDQLGYFSYGLAISDFTETNIYWETKNSDKIDINIKNSIAYEQPLPIWDMMLNISAEINNRYDEEVRFGGELQVKKSLFIRVGYNGYQTIMGCGLAAKLFKMSTKLDYALFRHELGNSHRIGVSLCL